MAADANMDTCPSPEIGDSRKRPLDTVDNDTENESTKRSHFSPAHPQQEQQQLHQLQQQWQQLQVQQYHQQQQQQHNSIQQQQSHLKFTNNLSDIKNLQQQLEKFLKQQQNIQFQNQFILDKVEYLLLLLGINSTYLNLKT